MTQATADQFIAVYPDSWKAITQHRQQLNQWTQKVDIALNSWREKKQRLQARQTPQERQSTAALLAENRPDQKDG